MPCGFLWLCGLFRPHDAALAVPRPHNGIPHSAPRSLSKSRADHERTQTPDSHTDLFATSCCAPHPRGGATESPSLWPRTIASVISFAMARLPRACHIPDGRRLLSSHCRAALRGTTVADPRWHGVSGRGASASDAWLPKGFPAQASDPSQTLVRLSAFLRLPLPFRYGE